MDEILTVLIYQLGKYVTFFGTTTGHFNSIDLCPFVWLFEAHDNFRMDNQLTLNLVRDNTFLTNSSSSKICCGEFLLLKPSPIPSPQRTHFC